MKRILSLLFLSSLLAACAGTIAGVPPNSENVKTVGIISAIGDKFYVRKVGVTVFGNDAKEFPIDSWGIDDFVIERIRARLSKRFDVRSVVYQKAAFLSATNSWDGIAKVVGSEVSPQGLDAYIVITKAANTYGDTNQIVRALGIVEGAGGVLTNARYNVHALYEVSVIDGHKLTTIGRAFGSLPDGRPIFPVLRGVNREIDQSFFPMAFDAAQNQKLKDVLKGLIGESLPNTLQKLQLAD